MSLREAAQAALEALESLQGGCTDSDDGTVEAITVWCPEIIEALRDALAEAPKAEPVPGTYLDQIAEAKQDMEQWPQWMKDAAQIGAAVPPKAEPVAWRIYDHKNALGGGSWVTESQSDALEATQAGCAVVELVERAPKAEPVAWRVRRSDGKYELYFHKPSAERAAQCYIKTPSVEPLYTHPPAALPESADEDAAIAKAWDRFTAELENPSPLTDEEILEIWSPSLDGSVQRPILGKNKIIAFARAVLAAARGKG